MEIETWRELEDAFDAMLDAMHGTDILGLLYTASNVLKQVDPTAYRCDLLDYADACGVDTDELAGEPSL